MASELQLLATPNPEEFSFRVRVPDDKIRASGKLGACGKLLRYMKYKDFAYDVQKKRVTEFADYVYTYAEQADADHKWFYFAKERTPEERDTPFEEFYSTRQYAWPAVLEDLFFVQTNSFPLSTNTTAENVVTATRYFPRYKFRPPTVVDSRIKVQQYLSEKPWPAAALIHSEPQPTDINGDYLGVSVSFPRCLHPRVELPELVPGASVVFNAGVVNRTRGGAPQRQVFPATNFEDWRPFVIEDRVEPRAGLWLREKVTIYPPARQESIEN